MSKTLPDKLSSCRGACPNHWNFFLVWYFFRACLVTCFILMHRCLYYFIADCRERKFGMKSTECCGLILSFLQRKEAKNLWNLKGVWDSRHRQNCFRA